MHDGLVFETVGGVQVFQETFFFGEDVADSGESAVVEFWKERSDNQTILFTLVFPGLRLASLG